MVWNIVWYIVSVVIKWVFDCVHTKFKSNDEKGHIGARLGISTVCGGRRDFIVPGDHEMRCGYRA